MSPLIWLALAVAAGAGAVALGWPVWQAVRERRTRDTNADRYLAWRGRAAPPSVRGRRASLSEAERNRAWLAAGLAALGIIGLLVYLAQA